LGFQLHSTKTLQHVTAHSTTQETKKKHLLVESRRARGSVVVKAPFYKPDGRGFDTR
jgi:hypothetical protein